MTAPTRPALRWHGGKWKLAPWVISHMPPHRIYVEPFGGAASVLLRKPPAYAEIYNDLDDDVVALFRVLRDPERASRLVGLLELTPFARSEFAAAYAPTEDIVERSRRLIVRSFMGFGSDSTYADRASGFRANATRQGTIPAGDWRNYPDSLRLVAQRLRGVIVENRPAQLVMQTYDALGTLHYVDPPYLPETRSANGKKRGGGFVVYRHEMTRDDHVELLDFLRGLEGMVLLSGYPHRLYDEALPEWRRVSIPALADGAREREEVLWINPACLAALASRAGGHGTPLFNSAEGRKPDRASAVAGRPAGGQPPAGGGTAREADR